MIKRMLKQGYININKLLLENYLNLRLDEEESICLMQIISYYEKGKGIGFSTLKGKTTLNPDKLERVITSLIDKGYLEVISVVKGGKETLMLDASVVADRISEYFKELDRQEKKSERESFMSSVVELIEKEFGRQISANEIQIISEWCNIYNYEQIRNALFVASKNEKLSVTYMDRVLINGNN